MGLRLRLSERGGRRKGSSLATLLAVGAIALLALHIPAAAQSSVFVVSNYPVQATAADAVTAKAEAMAEGEQGAFRYLMKRLVAVSAYKQLPKLTLSRIEDLIEGVSVRGEQNSATEYVATLEFSFREQAVRQLLRSYNLPFVDQQAPPITLIPVYFVPPESKSGKAPAPAAGQRLWKDAWTGLDLVHALTPMQLGKPGPSAKLDTFVRLAKGDMSALGVIAAEMRDDRFVLALAHPEDDGKRLAVLLIGKDGAGRLWLRRSYRLEADDPAYTAEFAAIIALATIEGRWKARQGGAAMASLGGGTEVLPWQQSAASRDSLQLYVQFDSAAQWGDIQQRLASIPGVANMQTGAISARSAELTLSYPGGAVSFRSAAAGAGLRLGETAEGRLVLQSY